MHSMVHAFMHEVRCIHGTLVHEIHHGSRERRKIMQVRVYCIRSDKGASTKGAAVQVNARGADSVQGK